MTTAMGRLEKLSEFLVREREIAARTDIVSRDAQAFDQEFNDWVQKELGLKEIQRKVHLAEIMKMMLETSMEINKSTIITDI